MRRLSWCLLVLAGLSGCSGDDSTATAAATGAGGAAGSAGASGAGTGGAAGGASVSLGTAIAIFGTKDVAPAIDAFVAPFDPTSVGVLYADDPASVLASSQGSEVAIALVSDLSCAECFRVDGASGKYTVHGGDVLGLQYGLAQAFEGLGYRFFHPKEMHVPASLASLDGAPFLGVMSTPAETLRGLHLHTIHPIESYFDFWVPSDDGLAEAKRVIDWTVKNRGNFLEWVALQDIQLDAMKLAAWQAHTKQILDYAHARGVKIGMGIQLFGTSSLQNGFSLLKNGGAPNADETIQAGLHLLLDGMPFDQLDLSFGEFSGVQAQTFIDRVNLVATDLAMIAPGVRLDTTVHLGNYPSLQLPYMGQTYLYYYLVQFCDPSIVAWVHSVMYYDLFEDTGGAYGYDDFSTHREFLLSYLAHQKPVGYFPEDAYWVDFDDSVPTYLPLYMRSRFVDLQQLGNAADAQGSMRLQEQVLFSSGFEWGYWQNDYAALRMSYALPDTWDAPVKDMLAPYGAPGAALAEQVRVLGEAEHDGLITSRLAAYMAGRDATIDLGAANGIVAAPARPSFADVAAMSASDVASFQTNVVAPLDVLATAAEGARDAAMAAGADATDPFLSEILDGIAVTAARARFAHSVFGAVVSHVQTGSDGGLLAAADAALSDGQTIVTRRHAHLHDGSSGRLTQAAANDTIYQYGYLYMADSVCFWRRERAQAGNAVSGMSASVPECAE